MTAKDLTAHLQTVHAADRFEAASPADATAEALPPRPDAITGGTRTSPPPAERALPTTRAPRSTKAAAPKHATPLTAAPSPKPATTAAPAPPAAKEPSPAAAQPAAPHGAGGGRGGLPSSYYDPTLNVVKLKYRRNGWVVCPFDTMHTVRPRAGPRKAAPTSVG